jgi:hypothetical protein
MSDNLETIKDKVRKLLALSKSDNENEAAIALKKANELISKFELDEKSLRFESVSIKSSKTYVAWRTVVANAVSWLYGCHHYRDGERGVFIFTGEELDSFMAGEMFEYLVKTIERSAKKTIRKNAKFKFRRDFKYGMASRLYDRIMELGEACSWSPRRNVKIEEAEEYVKRSVALCDSDANKQKNWNRTALARGMLHANNVSLARQAGYAPVPQIAGTNAAAAQGELF